MTEEKTAEITQPSPFSDSAWSTTPPTKEEPLKDEKEETIEKEKPTADTKDPVIEEKDEKIKEDKPTSDKPDDPNKIPAASPHDIPKREKEGEEKITTDKTTELKFANETSEKIFNLLKDGKEEDVLEFLNKKQTLKNIDKLSSAEVIKLQLKNENKDYTQQEIEDLFQEKFSLPEKPEQDITETDEDFAERENKYKEQLGKIERRIEREAKNSKAELLKLQQELVLPDIPQKTPEPQKPTQEELDKALKQQEQFLQAREESLKELNGYNAIFKDKDVEIPIAYNVAEQEKEELKPLLDSLNSDLPQFFTQLGWIDKDGNPNLKQVVSDLHIIKNKDAVIQKLVNEAGNKRYKEAIKSQKNIDFSSQQRRGSLEPSVQEEVDKKVRGFLQAT